MSVCKHGKNPQRCRDCNRKHSTGPHSWATCKLCEQRVRDLTTDTGEFEGLTTSDAQGIAMAEHESYAMCAAKEIVRKDRAAGLATNTYITQVSRERAVHRWYDPHTLSWCVQTVDADEIQIGSADYVHSAREAKLATAARVKELS